MSEELEHVNVAKTTPEVTFIARNLPDVERGELSSKEKIKYIAVVFFLVPSVAGFPAFLGLDRFGDVEANYNSAVWCGLLVIAGLLLLGFFFIYRKGELHKMKSSMFSKLKYVTIALVLCSWIGCITNIVVGVQWEKDFVPHSHYFAAFCAFWAGFWFVVFYFDCIKYENLLERRRN